MVQELYHNPIIGSRLLYFHRPDKDAVFAVSPDANNKPVNEDRNSVTIVDNELYACRKLRRTEYKRNTGT